MAKCRQKREIENEKWKKSKWVWEVFNRHLRVISTDRMSNYRSRLNVDRVPRLFADWLQCSVTRSSAHLASVNAHFFITAILSSLSPSSRICISRACVYKICLSILSSLSPKFCFSCSLFWPSVRCFAHKPEKFPFFAILSWDTIHVCCSVFSLS